MSKEFKSEVWEHKSDHDILITLLERVAHVDKGLYNHLEHTHKYIIALIVVAATSVFSTIGLLVTLIMTLIGKL